MLKIPRKFPLRAPRRVQKRLQSFKCKCGIYLFKYFFNHVIFRPAWGYTCDEDLRQCIKVQITEENSESLEGLSSCRLWCNAEGIGSLWPRPTENVNMSTHVVQIDPFNITVSTENFQNHSAIWHMAHERFLDIERRKLPRNNVEEGGLSLTIRVSVEVEGFGREKK